MRINKPCRMAADCSRDRGQEAGQDCAAARQSTHSQSSLAAPARRRSLSAFAQANSSSDINLVASTTDNTPNGCFRPVGGGNSHYAVVATLLLHFVPHFLTQIACKVEDEVEDKVAAIAIMRIALLLLFGRPVHQHLEAIGNHPGS